MGKITVLFGTESGNAEMVAEEVAEALTESGQPAEAIGMDAYPAAELGREELVVLITSTYGEGELPLTTAPFHDALLAARPDLSSLTFAAFGLGDSSYDTYNNAIATVAGTVVRLGGRQLGVIGLHDADSGLDPCAVAVAWARETFQPILAV